MDKKFLYLLLRSIDKNSNIKQLTREGLDFPKIADLLSNAIKEGYLLHKEDEVLLSEKGIAELKNLERHYKKINKNEWIELEKSSKISKIEKNDIYLPNQDDLWFS